MPYSRLSELPASVRRSLPKHAQEIYRNVFNHAWAEYAQPGLRRDRASREETAHRVAWAAVKRSYVKDAEGEWRERDHA